MTPVVTEMIDRTTRPGPCSGTSRASWYLGTFNDTMIGEASARTRSSRGSTVLRHLSHGAGQVIGVANGSE